MSNEVLIEGWLGADPKNYPETEDKRRFVKFDLAQKPRYSKKPPNWITCNAYTHVAEKIVDDLVLQKGDKVRVSGFLGTRYANPGCGRSHRFTVVIVNDILRIDSRLPPDAIRLNI